MGNSHALTAVQTFTKILCTVAADATYVIGTNEMPAGLYRLALVYDSTAGDGGQIVIKWYPRVADDQTTARATQNAGGVWPADGTTSAETETVAANAAGAYLYLTIGRGGGGSSMVQDIPLPFGIMVNVVDGTDVGDAFTLTLIATRIG